MSSSRQARVRASWSPPPGPLPAGSLGDPSLVPSYGETLDALAGDFRIFQRADGHRYSTDDLLTAWYASHHAARLGLDVRRYVDLGSGIGSVAMIVAWRFPAAHVTAIEAQALSASLCARSLRYNGLGERMELLLGDLREHSLAPDLATSAELVTGSPPYIPDGRGTVSARPQCDPCRFERRGGVLDYALAAARVMAPHGLFALVHEDRAFERVRDAGNAAGLALIARRRIVFREGKEPLIAVYAFAHAAHASANAATHTFVDEPPLVIRTKGGARGAEYRDSRGWMGFPP